ncbi:MAG: hypothetical protein V4577_06080 [Bacteroidota bacterium]
MKTIAVLTDLSRSGEHATQFALHMAKKMKANVLLFNTNCVPAARQLVPAGQEEPEPDNGLADFGHRMEERLMTRTFPGSFLPEIHMDNDNKEIVDIMTSLMQNPDISLVITAPETESDLASYMISDDCNRIIDWATVPVMVIPECAPLRNFEKIAFASQLHEEDINSISELGKLLESFAAELMVAHLNSDWSDQAVREKEEKLNRDLYKKLDCGGVYFRSIPDTVPYQNWDWLKANKRTDLLAVVQQPRERMTRFFQRGKNPSVTHHLTVPVLVLPKKP